MTRGGTTDPEAYDLFLRALFFRQQSTEQGMLESVKHYRAALKRAPDFARAHAALAEAYCMIGYYGFQPPSEIFPAAAAAAREALRFDPELPAAHNALGYVALYYDWDWALADREFRRSIALDPNYGLVRQWYGNLLTAMGRFGEAEEEMRRSQALDAFRRCRERSLVGFCSTKVTLKCGRPARPPASRASRRSASYEIAKVHLALGDRAGALSWLGDADGVSATGIRPVSKLHRAISTTFIPYHPGCVAPARRPILPPTSMRN